MKAILMILMLIGYAGAQCTSPISRTNNSANTVLTSTKYNTDLNTVYTHTNDLNGSCLTDSTVTFAKLDTSTLGVLLNAPQLGCKVTRSDAATLQIDRCYLAVNGNFVETTGTNNVTWGCSGCSAEAASTEYYVYVNNGSTGSTMNLSILTGAPNNDGYDSSNNRVLARFYNNGSSDIDQYAVDLWNVNHFVQQSNGFIDAGSINITGVTSDPSKGNVVVDKLIWKRDGPFMHLIFDFYTDSAGSAGSGTYLLELPNGNEVDTAAATIDTNRYNNAVGSATINTPAAGFTGNFHIYDSTHLAIGGLSGGSTYVDWGSTVLSLGSTYVRMSGNAVVPIKGWK